MDAKADRSTVTISVCYLEVSVPGSVSLKKLC